ncbi:MAG: DUF1294 domain-containing protein [Clostridia bacterium]|nr:DUF1294 domain-containing protein [Clostridia bacterium]
MKTYQYILFAYFVIITLVGIILTVYDKSAAIHHRRRIPERTLMALGFFGSSAVIYITMRLIHHKTKHKKFMIGLPIFFILHIIITIGVIAISMA